MKLRSHKSVVLFAVLVLVALTCAQPLRAAPPTASQGEKVQGVEKLGFGPGPWLAALWDVLRFAWGTDEGGARIDPDGLTVVPPEEGGPQAQSAEDPGQKGTRDGAGIDIDG